jgi:hypothetical protein
VKMGVRARVGMILGVRARMGMILGVRVRLWVRVQRYN